MPEANVVSVSLYYILLTISRNRIRFCKIFDISLVYVHVTQTLSRNIQHSERSSAKSCICQFMTPFLMMMSETTQSIPWDGNLYRFPFFFNVTPSQLPDF